MSLRHFTALTSIAVTMVLPSVLAADEYYPTYPPMQHAPAVTSHSQPPILLPAPHHQTPTTVLYPAPLFGPRRVLVPQTVVVPTYSYSFYQQPRATFFGPAVIDTPAFSRRSYYRRAFRPRRQVLGTSTYYYTPRFFRY